MIRSADIRLDPAAMAAYRAAGRQARSRAAHDMVAALARGLRSVAAAFLSRPGTAA